MVYTAENSLGLLDQQQHLDYTCKRQRFGGPTTRARIAGGKVYCVADQRGDDLVIALDVGW